MTRAILYVWTALLLLAAAATSPAAVSTGPGGSSGGGGGGGGNGPTNLIAFVDGVGGSDATGVAGNGLKPFKTFDALLLATSNYPAGGTLQMAAQQTYSYGVRVGTEHAGVTNYTTNAVNNYLGTLNAWGATILCTNGISPIASLWTVPFVMNGGNIIGLHSPNAAVDPTNIFYFVSSSGVSGSYTWNGTSFFAASDGLFVPAWPNNSTVTLNNCSFVSSYDTWNCGQNLTNSGCVFNLIGTRFFASNWVNGNPFYGVTVRSIAAQAAGTYYINGCQLTAIGGTNLTTCIEAGGGSVMYISGTTFTSSGPNPATTYDLYVDDVNTVVYLRGCLIDTNKIGGPGKANVFIDSFAKTNVWAGSNTFTGGINSTAPSTFSGGNVFSGTNLFSGTSNSLTGTTYFGSTSQTKISSTGAINAGTYNAADGSAHIFMGGSGTRFDANLFSVAAGSIDVGIAGNEFGMGRFTKGIETLGTNYAAASTFSLGFTNSAAYGYGMSNMVVNVYGTSGNIIFLQRGGASGGTAASIALYTNTIVATGEDIYLGVNQGINVTSGVNIVITARGN